MWKEMAMKMNILRINYWKWVFHFNVANFLKREREREIVMEEKAGRKKEIEKVINESSQAFCRLDV